MALTSDQILQQYLQSQQAANKWNSPQNLINLATLGLGGIGGLASGSATGKQNALNAQDLAYRQAQDAYMRRLQARQGLQSAILGQLDARAQGARDMANQSPLGAEQMFATQMARARGLSDVAGNFKPIGPAAGSTINTPSMPNVVGAFATPDYRSTISQDATARSIADRRKVLAGLDPDMQFGSMQAYGLPGNLDSEVEGYRHGRQADRLGRENQLQQLLNNQMLEASQPLYQAPTAQAQEPEQKKGGFWKKFGSIALPVAGLVATGLSGGALSPVMAAILAGGAGAAGGALGGGAKGALAGGMAGAGAGYALDKAGGFGGIFGSGGGGAVPQAGFEGPNLANYGMLPGGSNINQILMPDVPSFAPPLASRPNAPMAPYNQGPSMQQAILGGGARSNGGPMQNIQPVLNSIGGLQWIRMIAPDGTTRLAEPQDVAALQQMGYRPAPIGTPYVPMRPSTPAQRPFPVR